MAQNRFLIAPMTEGRQSDVKPFLIPDEAYAELNNVYNFRGRLRKRFGARPLNTSIALEYQQLYTRLRHALPGGANVGITTAGGNAAGIIPGAGAGGAESQIFSIGNQIFTIYDIVTPGAVPMLATGGAGTFNIATGAYAFVGCTPATQIYWYPSLPVMGFCTYETGAVNNNPVIAFDQKYAYLHSAGGWNRLGAGIWTSTDLQFFWGANWQSNDSADNLLYVTNNNTTDHVKYWTGVAWVDLRPRTRATLPATDYFIETARLVITFKDRLLMLNTTETEGAAGAFFVHVNRVRWCQNASPVQDDAWREDIPGKGGWRDAPTRQSIITASILKDRLIVYFSSSTWELVYMGNEVDPFRWYQLNNEFGSEATFSQISFDKVILGIGNVGIQACNGAQVERIDEKNPQDVFDIHANNDGTQRIHGVRDFYTEMVYWSIVYPTYLQRPTYKFPNRILVYNYKSNTWSYNDDSITAFGYYEKQDARTWANMDQTWADTTDIWDSGQLANNPKLIIAGNQEGFTFIVDQENPRNSIGLSITNIDNTNNVITVINHNLREQEFILIENCQGLTNFNNRIFRFTVIDDNHIGIIAELNVTIYTGGGTITRVSQIDILTKQYNFFLKEARNAFINKVDFLVDRDAGQVTVECFPSYSNIPLVEDGIASNVLIGTSILELTPYRDNESQNIGTTTIAGLFARIVPGGYYAVGQQFLVESTIGSALFTVISSDPGPQPMAATVGNGSFDFTTGIVAIVTNVAFAQKTVSFFPYTPNPVEQSQSQYWHPVYFQAEGEAVQLRITLSTQQMLTYHNALSDFTLNAMAIYAMPTASRFQ